MASYLAAFSLVDPILVDTLVADPSFISLVASYLVAASFSLVGTYLVAVVVSYLVITSFNLVASYLADRIAEGGIEVHYQNAQSFLQQQLLLQLPPRDNSPTQSVETRHHSLICYRRIQ